MLAVNYSTIRNKLKDYFDKVTDDYETVIVTRKDEKNVVLISLDEYNTLKKAAKNAAYLNMLDKPTSQLAKGDSYGCLNKYADASLITIESGAWEQAVMDKYANR